MSQLGHEEGYFGVKPIIKKVSFESRGKMSIYLEDGRIITIPLSRFPSIRRMNEQQRKQYQVVSGDTLLWKHSNEVYHIEQFIGREKDYNYKGISG